MSRCEGTLGLWKSEIILQRPVRATDEGHVEVLDGYKEELIDVLESSIWCSECGMLNTAAYERHGVSEDWEER